MQIIIINGAYILFVRYGRIGEVGRISHKKHTSMSSAISFFKKQFRSKTGNSWEERDDFVKKDKKYYLAEIECVEMSNDESDESDRSDGSGGSKDSAIQTGLDLDDRVIDFLKLISNIVYMNNTLIQLEIDTEKMPLGKISQTQIDKAYEILNKINNSGNHLNKLTKLSSEFYTLIPYACGRRKPPIISNKKLIAKNINLLNELSQMVVGSKTVTKLKNQENLVIQLYKELKTNIIPLDKTHSMYKLLVEYLYNSHAQTHHFKFTVLDIFELDRDNERDIYESYSKKITNKVLLFHGTRVSNLIGILKNGLVVDPSKLGINVNITGKMFG